METMGSVPTKRPSSGAREVVVSLPPAPLPVGVPIGPALQEHKQHGATRVFYSLLLCNKLPQIRGNHSGSLSRGQEFQ